MLFRSKSGLLQQRVNGYNRALFEAGCEVDLSLIYQGDITHEYGMEAAEKILKRQDFPASFIRFVATLFAFFDEVLKALWGYISDKLNIPVSRLSKDNIEEKLRNHGVNEELIKEFLNALNDCEFARFAPGDENQAKDKVYSSSIEVISKMENIKK